MVPRAKTLTDRTTTHRFWSPVSDPSELGSEPDSWLEYRYLRARMKIQIMGTRVSRDWWKLRHGYEMTSRQHKRTKQTSRERMAAWCRGPRH